MKIKCSKCGATGTSLVGGLPERRENVSFDDMEQMIASVHEIIGSFTDDGTTITMSVPSKMIDSREKYERYAGYAYLLRCKHEWEPMDDDEAYMKRELDKESGW